MGLPEASSLTLTKSARWLGSITRASTREARRAIMTTIGIPLMNLPIIPDMNRSGEKEAIVVRTAAVTAPMTSSVPFTEASLGGMPSSI